VTLSETPEADALPLATRLSTERPVKQWVVGATTLCGCGILIRLSVSHEHGGQIWLHQGTGNPNYNKPECVFYAKPAEEWE